MRNEATEHFQRHTLQQPAASGPAGRRRAAMRKQAHGAANGGVVPIANHRRSELPTRRQTRWCVCMAPQPDFMYPHHSRFATLIRSRCRGV